MVRGSLLEDVRRTGVPRWALWARRGGLGVLLVVVLLGASGLLGVHSRTVSVAGADGYTLAVTYPQVARPGLDIPLSVRVAHPGGVDADVTIAISADYLTMFETQGFNPDASDSTSDGEFVYLTFSKPPPGHDFQVDYDAYVQPASQKGKTAVVRLIIGGRELARTSVHTWLAP